MNITPKSVKHTTYTAVPGVPELNQRNFLFFRVFLILLNYLKKVIIEILTKYNLQYCVCFK